MKLRADLAGLPEVCSEMCGFCRECGGDCSGGWRNLAAGSGSDDEEGLGAACDGFGEWGIGRLVGDVLFADEEAQEGAALLCVVITNGSAERGVSRFEGVDDGALGDGAFDIDGDFSSYLREGAEMRG